MTFYEIDNIDVVFSIYITRKTIDLENFKG